MPDMQKKVLVIGGGPGGYVAAIRAAQLGADVTLIEREALGGTCLNRGCIPAKVMLHAAKILDEAKRGEKIGIRATGLRVDWPALATHKCETVARLAGGVEFLLRANGVDVVRGDARFLSSQEVEVTLSDETRKNFAADATILASGSSPDLSLVPGFDLPGVLTAEEAFSLAELPASVLLVGGGTIGVEFASAFASFGVDVTVLETRPDILSNHDSELVGILRRKLVSQKVKIHTSSSVQDIRLDGGQLTAVAEEEGKDSFEICAEKVVVCAGRRPNTTGMGLEEMGVRMDHGRIWTDTGMSTNIPGLYAVGDCASPFMLAHVASAEGEVAAENIMGQTSEMDYSFIPICVHTSPELASVGMLEKSARASGRDIKIGRFPLLANGKAVISGEEQGMIKIVADADTGEVLGAHMLAPRATDLIMEAALSMRGKAAIDEIATTIHAHPSLSEGFREAALDVLGRAIHIPPARR